jgi:hypothetical protein
MRSVLALAALLLPAAGCTRPAAPAGGEMIVVDAAPVVGICAGTCPDYRLTVSSDGAVELIGDRLGRDEAQVARRWRISPDRFPAFRAALAPFRPDGTRRDGSPHHDPDFGTGRGYSVEIDWRGPRSQSHLSAQLSSSLSEALDRAVCAIGVDRELSSRLDLIEPRFCGHDIRQ